MLPLTHFIRLMRNIVLLNEHDLGQLGAGRGRRRWGLAGLVLPCGFSAGSRARVSPGMGGNDVDGLLAFPVRRPEPPGSRSASTSACSPAAKRPPPRSRSSGRPAAGDRQRRDLGREPVRDRPDRGRRPPGSHRGAAETLPADDFGIGELAGRLIASPSSGRAAASPSATPRSASSTAFGRRGPRRREREARHRLRPSSAPRRRPGRARREPVDVVLGDDSGGRPLTMFTLWPATWLRIRWSVKSGTTTSWAKIPGCIFSSMRQVVLPLSGSPNSIAHIRPSPRTSFTTS